MIALAAIAAAASIRYSRPPLEEYQLKAFFAPQRISLVEGATKTGKGYSGMAWLLEQALINPQSMNYWWVAPVYPQAAIAYRRLKDAIPASLRKANDSDMTLRFPNRRMMWFKSGEKPDNLFGEDVGAAVIDEASRLRQESWHAVRSTLTYTRGPIRIIGNVKGKKNWFYHLCRKAQAGGEADMLYSKFVSAQAVEVGILDAAEIEGARRDLPESVFKELYLAEASDDLGNPFGSAAIRACVRPMSPQSPVAYGIDLAKHVDYTVEVGLDINGQVCRFERYQRSWEQTIDEMRARVGSVPALVDSTGVGDPVLESLQKGQRQNFEGYGFTQASKQKLMEGLAVAIQRGEVFFPEGPITMELDSFEYEYTRTGVRYEASAGMHDDCVMALGLAVMKRTGSANMPRWRPIA